MSDLEIYLLLFTDSLVSNLAFNASSEIAIGAMRTFGLYNPYMIIATAGSAYLIAIIINYFLGKICYNILSNKEEEKSAPYLRIEKLRESRYIFVFILLSAIPFFGKFIILFTGFCRIKLSRVISYGMVAKIIYYSYFIFVV
jgi:membrane protein YqaA with SNARE-associated domain